jgi:hypothetical protein
MTEKNVTVKDVIKKLSEYPPHTRLDFIIVEKDWHDSAQDIYLDYFGIVGSGADEDCEDMYIELAFKVVPDSKEYLIEQLEYDDEKKNHYVPEEEEEEARKKEWLETTCPASIHELEGEER